MAAYCSCAARANPHYEAWQKGRPFTLSAWTTHEAGGGDTLDLEYFKASGLNTAFEGRCAYNSERPMPDLGEIPCIYFVYGNKLPDLEGFIADFEKARKKHNIVALMLGDEVVSSHGEDGLKHYGQIRDWVANNPDPAISSLLTITCVPGGDKASGSAHLKEYFATTVERLKPDVILPQFYPAVAKDATGDMMSSTYYSSLEWWFNWATARDRQTPLWSCNRAWTSGPPLPSESSLRLQRFAGLAYGVRGMVDFLWIADFNPSIKDAGYWNVNGPNPTVLYKHLAPINRELATLGKAMLQLTPVGVYHMDSRGDGDGVRHWSDSDKALPAWMRRGGKLVNVTGMSNANHVMVGFFRDPAGEEYCMVVNKDVNVASTGAELASSIQLTFHPSVTAVQRLNRITGGVDRLIVKGGNVAVTLPGGTGDLFKFDTGKPFAGLQQVDVPGLASSDPVSGGTLCKLFGNEISLSFDRDPTEVRAEIRKLDETGNETGEDLSAGFERVRSGENTVVYREKGSVLVNRSQYLVRLHWADCRPLKIITLRGDVDGDGQVAQKDSETATAVSARLAGQKTPYERADLNADGYVNEDDLQDMEKMVNFRKFDWSEDFERYPAGPLTGNGPWKEAETIPGSVLSKGWVNGPMILADATDLPQGGKWAGGKSAFHGNEARFHEGAGFDSVGILRVAFTSRVGRGGGYQNTGFHIWGSPEKKGSFGVEQMRGTVKIFGGGEGPELLPGGTTSVTVEGGQGPGSKGVRVEFAVDFEASTLTWQCRDLDHDKLYGPFEVGYTGTVRGLNGMDIIGDVPEAQIDDIRITNYH